MLALAYHYLPHTSDGTGYTHLLSSRSVLLRKIQVVAVSIFHPSSVCCLSSSVPYWQLLAGYDHSLLSGKLGAGIERSHPGTEADSLYVRNLQSLMSVPGVYWRSNRRRRAMAGPSSKYLYLRLGIGRKLKPGNTDGRSSHLDHKRRPNEFGSWKLLFGYCFLSVNVFGALNQMFQMLQSLFSRPQGGRFLSLVFPPRSPARGHPEMQAPTQY